MYTKKARGSSSSEKKGEDPKVDATALKKIRKKECYKRKKWENPKAILSSTPSL
jgi:hypothetical protein